METWEDIIRMQVNCIGASAVVLEINLGNYLKPYNDIVWGSQNKINLNSQCDILDENL